MKWFSLTLINMIASLLNYPLAPIITLFASDDGWLPSYLWWFQTPDNPLDGDDGWKIEHRPFKVEDSKFKRWVNRTFWLYRNSMYGLSETLLGFTIMEGYEYSCIGDESVSNRPLHNGLVKRYLVQENQLYWQWYYVKSWSDKYCVRINLGWKLWGDKKPGDKVSIVCSINPFMGYSNK